MRNDRRIGMKVTEIIQKEQLQKEDLIYLLSCTGEEEKQLFAHTQQLRNRRLGNGVYMRGLIEISNICTKDCLYCGIRKSNTQAQRYQLSDEEILDAAHYAWEHHYGSIVLQGG